MKITTDQAAKLIGTTPYSINAGIQEGNLEIGFYRKKKGCKRGQVIIVPMMLARKLKISEEELEKRINNLQN